MTYSEWQTWGKRPTEAERTLILRAQNKLPEMECTKQLVSLISQEFKPGMRVLDVGCNAGHYLHGMRRLGETLDYTGVDAYEHYIESAQEIFGDDPHARFLVRDVFEPLFPDDPYDIVYCCNVLLHLPDFRKPLKNLLASTRSTCFIRTLFENITTIVKHVEVPSFDDEGNPLDYIYQNTWSFSYFSDYVATLGWKVEFIEDEFDPSALSDEFESVKNSVGTRIVDGKQIDGNILFNWAWARITK